MNKKVSYTPLYILTAILTVALVAAFAIQRPYTFHGTLIEPPLPVTDFSLQSGNEEMFRLSDQQGKIVLLFFGYTSCPDVCPITLGTFKQVYEKLGDDAEKVRFVMITADPERDTPDKVAAYAMQFNPEFVGLSGDLSDLRQIWDELGVFVEKQESDSLVGYLVSHTSSVYVFDPNGGLTMTFPYGTSVVDISDDLIQLLKQSDQE